MTLKPGSKLKWMVTVGFGLVAAVCISTAHVRPARSAMYCYVPATFEAIKEPLTCPLSCKARKSGSRTCEVWRVEYPTAMGDNFICSAPHSDCSYNPCPGSCHGVALEDGEQFPDGFGWDNEAES